MYSASQDSEPQARNEMEGGSTERRVSYQTPVIEPQGKLKIPNPSLVLLIGPSGSGKSTFCT